MKTVCCSSGCRSIWRRRRRCAVVPFPGDVDNIKELKLDCLEASDDAENGIKWRSDTERNLMQSIPGWTAGTLSKAAFVPLSAILFGAGTSVVEGVPEVDVEGDGNAVVPDGTGSSCVEVAEEADVEMDVWRPCQRICKLPRKLLLCWKM